MYENKRILKRFNIIKYHYSYIVCQILKVKIDLSTIGTLELDIIRQL